MVTYNFPTRIFYGVGVRREVISALKEQGLKKPVLVTDRGVAELPMTGEFVEEIRKAGIDTGVFSEIWGNPVKSQVMAGVDYLREFGADTVIAFGGGAALDVAKVMAMMLHHPGDLFDYEDGKPDARPVDQKMPVIFALPTTAGTGSEVGRASVVSDDKTHVKKIMFDPRLLPEKVFLDPELSVALPATMTASTGLDALTHLIEAYLAKGFHPICDGIALEGISLVAKHLVPTFEFAKKGTEGTPEHLETRGMMLNAAMMGAVAFQKGLGVTHSCAHSLSTVCDLHHGLANGILLPYAMKYNSIAVPERFITMARTVGLAEHSPAALLKWLEDLKVKLEIPTTLSAVGVKKEHMNDLVDFALKDGCHELNPRPVSREHFQKIFAEAIGS